MQGLENKLSEALAAMHQAETSWAEKQQARIADFDKHRREAATLHARLQALTRARTQEQGDKVQMMRELDEARIAITTKTQRIAELEALKQIAPLDEAITI